MIASERSPAAHAAAPPAQNAPARDVADYDVSEYDVADYDASAYDPAPPASSTLVAALSWALAAWTIHVLAGTSTYRLTLHPRAEHVFGTVGTWLGELLGSGVGQAFGGYAAYLFGSVELAALVVLAVPAFAWLVHRLRGGEPMWPRAWWHRLGGAMAAIVTAGAVCLHLLTPLGIAIVREGESDGGSLFYATASVLVASLVLVLINRRGV